MSAVRPIRRGLDGLSPYDSDAVQRWMLQRVTDEMARTARVTPRLWLVCDDHLEDIDLTTAQGDPLGTFLTLADRVDVEHRLLCGSDEDADGRVAWVFAARNDEARSFWMGVRRFRRLPGGLGSVDAPFHVTSGVGLAEIGGPAVSLARPGPPIDLLPAAQVPLPKIFCRSDSAPAAAEMPADALAAINVIVGLGQETTAWEQGLEGLAVFVFRGRELERWHVLGEVPFGIDDLVRNICGYGDPASAVLTLCVDLFEHEGAVCRAVRTVAEAAGRRMERIAALRYEEGDDKKPSHIQFFGSVPREMGQDGWIGVDAMTELELFPMGGSAD